MLSALTLCSGIRTFMRKCLCSSLRGSAKPLIMLQENNIYVLMLLQYVKFFKIFISLLTLHVMIYTTFP